MKNFSRLLIFISLLLLSSLFVSSPNNVMAGVNQDFTITAQAYVTSSPILITSDATLSSTASSGDGSALTPWIIEGWNITSSASHLISVTGTTEYFVIRNNFLNGISQGFDGIKVDGVSNGLIFNNTITNSDNGIFIRNSIGITAANNTVTNSPSDSHLIQVRFGSDNIVSNNSLTMTDGANGVYLDQVSDVIVENNNIVNMDSKRAIYSTYSSDKIIIKNNYIINNIIFSNAQTGIRLSSPNSAIIDNVLIGGNYGILADRPNITISGNTFDTQTFYSIYIEDANNTVISNNIIRDGNHGININGRLNNNMFNTSITNNNINNTVNGIRVFTNISNVTITGNTATHGSIGLYVSTNFFHGNWFNISDNVLSNNAAYGLRTYSLNNSIIARNVILNGGNDGMNIGDMSNGTISFNDIRNNGGDGIYFDKSKDNMIINNTIHDNALYGINLISVSTNNTIANNSIIRNQNGLILQLNADDNNITNNLIVHNRFSGIYVLGNGNLIKLNDFAGNYIGGSKQARMDDSQNIATSNFWADWISPDSNNDLIVDSIYLFDGVGNDTAPSTIPISNWGMDLFSPFVNSPADLTFKITSNPVTLYWQAIATEATTFTVYNNTVAFTTGTNIVGVANQIDLGVIPIGVYNYTIVVTDASGRTGSDTILVEVTNEFDAPTIIGTASNKTIVTGEYTILSWSARDAQPFTYKLFKDNALYNTSTWDDNVLVSFDVSNFFPGVYNLTIEFYDVNGLTDSHTVFITVNPDIVSPTINNQASVTFNEGWNGYTAYWSVSDVNLQNFVIQKDGVSINATAFTSSTFETISIDLTGLLAGVYNYTLTATDVWGNSASGTIIVTVVFVPDIDAPTITLSPGGYMGFTEGATEFRIEYHVQDLHPGFYTLEQDGSIVQEGSWENGVPITYSLAGLSVGTYTFIMTFTDESGNSVFDVTTVEVTPQQTDEPPTTTTPTDTNSFEGLEPEDDNAGFLPISTNLFIFSLVFVVIVRRKINKNK